MGHLTCTATHTQRERERSCLLESNFFLKLSVRKRRLDMEGGGSSSNLFSYPGTSRVHAIRFSCQKKRLNPNFEGPHSFGHNSHSYAAHQGHYSTQTLYQLNYGPMVNQRGSELEMLQKEHEEKTRRIQQLREEIAETKSRLEMKTKENPGAEEKLEAFRGLVARYNSMRTEYNGLLTEKIKKERN